MKPLEALAVLDQATDPRNGGKLTRTDYAAAQQALQVLAEALSPQASTTANADPAKP